MTYKDIFQKIYQTILDKKDENKPFIIGINGIDNSGKTQFSLKLSHFLKSQRVKTTIIHIDDFHNPKSIRYAGSDQIDNFYNKNINISLLVEELLKPIKNSGTLNKKITLLNLTTDKFEVEKEYKINPKTVVIFEGIFLFRKELRSFLDYKIFIDIPFELAKTRAKIRDVPILGDGVLEKYDNKYIPAQKKYLVKHPPEKFADLIIDNTDWEKPIIKYNRVNEKF
jgi:uridine kinase